MIIPLIYLPDYSTAVIVDIKGGRGFVRRLYEMGLTPGTRIRILKSSGPGPLLIEVRGSRIALGRGIGMKIFVRPDYITPSNP